ncbi:MAG: hypothetical protein ACO3Q7_09170 [Steroidobacteraceae bacterium]
MTPADERVTSLLAAWRKSLMMHREYTRLSDSEYHEQQAWPPHERPSPWVVDMAAQRLADLDRIVRSRLATGDPSLSEALELMALLSRMMDSPVGQRFIPRAEHKDVAPKVPVAPVAVPSPAVPLASEGGNDGLSEMERIIIRDAKRLLGWGREWYELPSAISRMAGRPGPAEVHRVLKLHRADIEAALGHRAA